ncbi:glycosaminoglycan xylosylkinase-like [Mercenaria mercenaria]|uniref:glycosaminoglycan xylosylkinase-like n=1 Tax=Mercenaria mercenaria TaxID=6596 RepID=UPI00234FB114|nr:glycosaminoglycan xylosylkinase-like [Mercenaria mercenaria]
MRLKPRRVLLLALILFIFYVLYKILAPETSSKHIQVDKYTNKPSLTEARKNVTLKIEQSDVVRELKATYRLDWDHHLNESPWTIAQKWISKEHVHPENTPELGAVLRAMATRKIIAADVGYRGTQLKMTILLEGGQRAVFKPKWFPRDHVIEGPPYAGEDRHNGEIVAFHLGRLFDFRRTPLAVGRIVNLETEIKPVAKQRLLETFFRRGNNTCFYGKCYYCKGEETGLCGSGVHMEGTVVLWLPNTVTLKLHKHPWSRTYRKGVIAQWEKDDNYCHNTVLLKPQFQDGPRLLDIIDTAVFDYIIGNADRHHYETLGDEQSAVMLILDNAKSFGNPHNDERSILAPLYQCCRIRESTWLRLHMFGDGMLSDVLEAVLSADPIAPVISQHHFRAMDRRLSTVVNTVKTCLTKFSVNEVLIKNR